MKLLVVIANYRVAHLTIDCLRSIAAEIGSVPGTQVAVCENGTGDNSAERIQQAITDNGWSSWCTLTAVNPNLGFTGGTNIILRPALQSADPPQYFLLLNADTVVQPNAFRALVEFMDQHPRVGIAGSRLEYPDGTPQRSAFRFLTPLSEFEAGISLGPVSRLLERWIVAPPVPEQNCEADWVGGACMIIRREVFRDIGVLDEGYYTHFEDVDFCFNARKAGWPIWYVPTSRVISSGGTIDRDHGQESQTFPTVLLQGAPPLFRQEPRARVCNAGRCRADFRTHAVAATCDPWKAGFQAAPLSS